jgi:phosphopantetheinyl transferase
MPLFYQHNVNSTSKLAVWHITETEDFFMEKVHLQKTIMHPHKRLQHLAGRYLLQLLDPLFPIDSILISESKKPLLTGETFHFSISHCGDFAAAIISANGIVGIDVELVTPKIELVKYKFLRESELQLLPAGNTQLLTLLWSCKEAIYKWYGKGLLSFKENMIIDQLFIENEEGIVSARFLNSMEIPLKLQFKFFENLCLVWVIK